MSGGGGGRSRDGSASMVINIDVKVNTFEQ